MSPFQEAAAILGRQGIPVIPTRQESPSRPLVCHPDRFGVTASQKLASSPKFNHANAGIWTGQRSKLTVVDVDSPDPARLQEAIATFGDSPLKVATPSGGFHLYYRHTGERRAIRPFGKSWPVDVLGSGLAVVPPSTRKASGQKLAGGYVVLEGDLGDLSRLPRLRPGSLPDRPGAGASPAERADISTLREGDGRDNALFAIARNAARACNNLDDVRLIVMARNLEMAEPLPDAVAAAKAAQAWRYKLEGRLLATGERAAFMDMRAIELCTPYLPALALLNYLRAVHSVEHVFALVPEEICKPLHMSHPTARQARDFLLAAELLELVEVGGKTALGRKPNLYRLKPS